MAAAIAARGRAGTRRFACAVVAGAGRLHRRARRPRGRARRAAARRRPWRRRVAVCAGGGGRAAARGIAVGPRACALLRRRRSHRRLRRRGDGREDRRQPAGAPAGAARGAGRGRPRCRRHAADRAGRRAVCRRGARRRSPRRASATTRRTGWRCWRWISTPRRSSRSCRAPAASRRSPRRARRSSAGRVPVLAPSRWLREADPLPHSWDVTSDSIAAWVAGQAGASTLVLVKAAGRHRRSSPTPTSSARSRPASSARSSPPTTSTR